MSPKSLWTRASRGSGRRPRTPSTSQRTPPRRSHLRSPGLNRSAEGVRHQCGASLGSPSGQHLLRRSPAGRRARAVRTAGRPRKRRPPQRLGVGHESRRDSRVRTPPGLSADPTNASWKAATAVFIMDSRSSVDAKSSSVIRSRSFVSTTSPCGQLRPPHHPHVEVGCGHDCPRYTSKPGSRSCVSGRLHPPGCPRC